MNVFDFKQAVEDAELFRYLVEEADPRELVQLLTPGNKSMESWREALRIMRGPRE